jgi:hypothetical protein
VDVLKLWVDLVIRGEHRQRLPAKAAAAKAGPQPGERV